MKDVRPARRSWRRSKKHTTKKAPEAHNEAAEDAVHSPTRAQRTDEHDREETRERAPEEDQPREKEGVSQQEPKEGDNADSRNAQIAWETTESLSRSHSPDRLWSVLIITAALAFAAFIFGNWLFAVFIGLSGVTIVLLALQKPQRVTISLDQKGVLINQKRYQFTNLASFWISEDAYPPILILNPRTQLTPQVVLPVADSVSVEELRRFLAENVSEQEQNVPFAYQLLEIIGL